MAVDLIDPDNPCGTCNMCCKVYAVPEVGKLNCTQWCDKVRPGSRGCTIYADRPPRCSDFECVWLTAYLHGPERPDISIRPDKCGVVIAGTDNDQIFAASVNPGRPDAWRTGRIHSLIASIVVDRGIRVVVSHGSSTKKILLERGGPSEMTQRTIELSRQDPKTGVQYFRAGGPLVGLGG